MAAETKSRMGALRFGWIIGLSLAMSLPTFACECPPPQHAIENARGVVLARVVELSLPPLNQGRHDSLARAERLHGRAIVVETLRGDPRRVVEFVEPAAAGMCRSRSRLGLGETVVFFLPDEESPLELGLCTPTLRFGVDWQGWDEATLKFRDALRGPSRPLPEHFFEWAGDHLWIPMDPAPP